MIRYDAAVVGGGFSGCAIAAQLARRTGSDFALALFEPRELGRGAAYATPHREHLLNTRAAAMSVFPDEPAHFVRWLGDRGAPDDFVSRRLYGDYLSEIATRTFERPQFSVVPDRVASVSRRNGAFVLQTASGARFCAGIVVLATGNPLPEDGFLPRALLDHPGYVGDPWRFDYCRVGGHVMLIGSGLTALDAMVALESSGHRGAVHVVSRHARFPEVHAPGPLTYDVVPAIDPADAVTAFRSFRGHLGEAAQRGFDWRCVVDALRPETEALWRRLPAAERGRFERHLRGRWERHRHRAPTAVDAARARYVSAGRLFTYAGRLQNVEGSSVTVALKSGGTASLRPDWIVNCTGAGRARRALRDPMLAALSAEGTIVREPLGLGIRVDAKLSVIDASGAAVPGLYAIGPLVRGTRFEATAVPELRVMAEAIATAIASSAESELTLTG
jgi:uncharacterized NAD(P)/FAD-binding protein YdhS